MPSLEKLYIYDTDIEKIDLSNNKKLDTLQLVNTFISSLDLSQNTSLTDVLLRDNKYTPPDVKNTLESLTYSESK